MLQKITDLPDHVLGVKAIGEITAEDLKTILLPGLNSLVERYDAINYLPVLDTSIKNWTADAWLTGYESWSSELYQME